MAQRDLSSEIDGLASALADIRKSLADLPARLDDATEVSQRRLRRAGRAVSAAADDVRGRAVEGVDVLEDEIGARPLLAVGLAFLAGMAVDRFLFR